jgi:hypothetical protein
MIINGCRVEVTREGVVDLVVLVVSPRRGETRVVFSSAYVQRMADERGVVRAEGYQRLMAEAVALVESD